MKVLHTSDWHLGKYLNNYSRHNEQIEVLNEITAIADREQVNAVLIAGDLFDTFNPPIESTELFYKVIKKLALNGKRAVIAIAGNHDSPDRIEAPDPLARECGIVFVGYPNSIVPLFTLESGLTVEHSEAGFISVNLPGTDYPFRVLFTAYANEYRLRTYLGQENQEEELRDLLKKKWQELADRHCDNKGVNVLMAHLLFMKRGESFPEEPEDEKPILHIGGAQAIYTDDIPSQVQYTGLGHLHRRQFVSGSESPVVYSGSPLAYSFSEANQTKYVQLIDVEPGKPAVVSSIALETGKRLLKKRAESIDEAVEWLKENGNALVELTMVTNTFLTADDRKKLSMAHAGIVSIIPELKSGSSLNHSNQTVIDLTKDMEGLFTDYFYHAKGQKPNENMLRLFREVLSEDENN